MGKLARQGACPPPCPRDSFQFWSWKFREPSILSEGMGSFSPGFPFLPGRLRVVEGGDGGRCIESGRDSFGQTAGLVPDNRAPTVSELMGGL